MPVNLSIKNVPDELAERLRQRAARNHRSVQGELMAILEGTVVSGTNELREEHSHYRAEKQRTPREVAQRARTFSIRDHDKRAAEAIQRIREGGELPAPKGTLTIDEISERIRNLGLTSVDEATRIIREDRDR